MSGNSIEIPVRLSLEQAQSQAEALRRVLQESVQPNSSEYRAILNMIERATTQAERLKQTMGESFKTSSGSKKFNSELQKTFDLLATATGRLKDVSGKNLILSPEETTRVKEIATEIQKLQDEISNIQTGKIGNFFDDSSKEEFKNIQELAQKFTSDLSNMTFSGLSDKLTKELDRVNNDLEEAKQKTKELTEAQAKTEVTTNKDNFINNLIQQTRDATKLSAASASTLENQLTSLFSEYQHLFNGEAFEIGNINKTSSVSEILQNQLVAVENAITPQIAKIEAEIQKYQEAINKINNIKTEGFQRGGKGAAESRKSAMSMRDLANQAGVQVRERKSGESLADYQKDIVATLNSQMEQALSSKELFINAQDQLNRRIGEIFNNIGANTTIRTGGFKRIVETWLQGAGIDTGSNEIKLALTKMIEGANVGSTLEGLAGALTTHFSQGLQDAATQENQASAEAQQLKQALQTLGGIFEINNGKIEINKKRLQELAEEQDKVANGARERLGKSLDENPAIASATQQYNQATAALKNYANGLANLESKQKALSNVQNAVTRWMGFYQVLNLTKQAVNEMKQHIQELDSVMTQIAVVTNMSQDDLWGQIKQYSEIARQYGVAIKGVYEVSQIYYQQGLNKGDVMGLTTETLKMARIAGLDYATAADYMTTAIRGFKLEMTDAAHVTDVYSALAAKTASSTEELAVAISKTASSAEAVGSSFEATSAMMATMIATTRESATNIGTALKSVISRYGEMTSDPSKLVDSEGEEMSLNRVDKALQTVGITIHDVNGQFRDFDDVILELGEKWDTLDKNSQRYIATLMAGNRQQSRFLALVGNVDEYKNALEIAQNSEDAGELQTLKTLDSIDAKIEKMKVTIQEFYTSAGIQDLYKGILDTITNVIDAANNLPKAFGKIPAAALVIGAQVIAAIKNIVSLIINYISMAINAYKTKFNSIITSNFNSVLPQAESTGKEIGTRVMRGIQSGLYAGRANFAKTIGGILSAVTAVTSTIAAEKSIEALNDYGASTNEKQDQAAAGKMFGSTGFQIAGIAANVASGAIMGGLPGALMGLAASIPSIISAITSLNSGFEMYNVTLERSLELSNKRVEAARQESVKAKGEVNDLQSSINKLKQLEEAQYSSAEAMQEYIEYRNQLAETYPNLLSGYDSEYNAVINTADAYELLANKINEALQKEILYNKEELERARLKASAAEQYQQNVQTPLTGYYNGYDVSKIKFTTDSVDRSRYLTIDEWKQLGLDSGTPGNIFQQTFGFVSGDITERSYQNATFNPDKLYTLAENSKLWENQYYLIYDIMKQGGAFSGAFDDLIKTEVDQAKNLATIGRYDEAIKYLIQARQTILSSSQEYLDAQEKLQSEAARQSIALAGFTSASTSQITDTFYSNGILRSLFSSTVARANIDENNIVAVPEGYEDIKLNLEDYGRLLGEKLYNAYYSLTETNQKQLDNIIKNRADYTSFEEYQAAIIELFGQDLFSQDIWEGQKKAIEQETKNASERMTKYVEDLENRGKDAQAFEQLFTRQGNNLSYAYTDAVIKDMEYYISQIDNGLIIYGNNISDLIYKYWDAVGKISDADTQIKVSSMLRGIDRQDINEIDKLINTLENEEGYDEQSETGQVVQALKAYRDALNVSINTMTQEFVGKTKDAEKSIEDLSKIQKSGFSSFEDMSKAFQALESAGFTGTWTEAFVLDEGVWKYSAEGYKTAIGKINDTIEKDKEKLKTEIENLTGAQELIINSTNGVDFFTASNYDYVKKMLDKSDAYGIKGALKALYKITDEATLNQLTDQITSGIIPLGNSMEEFHNNILIWIKNQLGDAANQINGANQFIANLKFSQIDFNAIASGTANKDLTISQIQDALVTSGKQEAEASTLAEKIWNELIIGVYDTLNTVAPFLITDSFKESLRSDRISKYQTAISETLNASTAPVSAATAKLLGQADKAHQKIGLTVIESISKAKGFLDTIADSLSIEDYNKSAREILEKSLAITDESETQGNVYKAIDFATGNLDISSFETLANNFGAKLSDWFNLETGGFEWFDEESNQIVESAFKDILSYNKFTGQFDIIGTVDEFINAVAGATGTIIDKGTAEYARLSETAAISKQIEQMQSLADAKVGDILNVSYLDDLLTEPMIKLLEEAGVTIEDGIATIGENFNLKEVLNTLTSIDTSGSVQLANAVEELKDSIVDMINNWTSLIANGIEGKLSNAGKNELQKIANEQLNITLDDSAFTRTKDGLKLSQQAAIELYNALKQVDSIAAQITFDDLKKSLEDNNENYQSVSSIMAHIKDLQDKINTANKEKNSAKVEQYEQELAVAKEILAVRSQTDDDSFKFMDQALPGGQNNPLNYYDAMNKANKAISDAFNMGEGGGKGYMGYQDFYNIVTQINQMAAVSKQKIKIGAYTLSGNMQDAADLIEAGAGALASVDGGEMKVNLGKLGIDMQTGASQMRSGLNSGLKTMAQEQIKMLDAAIAMLEAVVAMEELGDIDANGDTTIDLSELGITVTGENEFEVNNKTFMSAAKKFSDAVTGLGDTANEIIINGHSLSEIAQKLKGTNGNAEDLKKALSQLGLKVEDLQSIFTNFYQLSQNQEWGKAGTDVISMIQDAFSGSGLSIDVNPFSKIKINYKDTDVQKRIEEVFKQKGKQSPEAQMKALEKKAKEKPKTLTWQDAYNLNYVAGKITVKKDKNGKEEYWYNGKKYSSKEEVGNIISLGAKTGASNVKARKNKDGVITGYEGTLSFKGAKYKVVTDKNGKISYEYNGEKNLTLSQVRQKIALDGLKGEKSKSNRKDGSFTSSTGKEYKGTETKIKMGSGTVTVVADENGQIQYKSIDGKTYKDFDSMIDANIKERSKRRGKPITKVTDADRKKYRLEWGFDAVPTFEDVKTSDLNQRNIKNLQKETAQKIWDDWDKAKGNKEKEADFEYTYGFKLTNNESVDDIQKLLDEVNETEEEKTMKLNPTIVGDDAAAAKKMLNGEEIVVPVKFETSTGDNSTPENGEGDTQSQFTQEVTAVITKFINGENVDPNTLVNALSAIIASYTDADAKKTLTVANAIAGVITAYTDPNASTTGLTKANNIEALVSAYTDADGNIDTTGLATTFAAVASAYKDATGGVNTDLLTTMFTAVADKYKDAQGNVNTDGLVTTFTAMVNAYKDATGGVDTSLLNTTFTAMADAYKDADGKINTDGLKTAITAFVNQYAKSPDGVTGEDTLSPMVDALVQAFAEAPDGADKSAIEALISNLVAKISEINPGAFDTWYEDNKEKDITVHIIPDNIENFDDAPQGDMTTNTAAGILNKVYQEFSNPEGAELDFSQIAINLGIDESQLINAWTTIQTALGKEIPLNIDGNLDYETIKTNIENWLKGQDQELTVAIGADTADATEESESAGTEIESNTYKINIDANMDPAIATIKAAELPSRTVDIYGNYKGEQQGDGQAKGNIALASGNAMASGTKTLMGELGPELVVSHGHYFVAGQNGAEFVDLDKDAIVFNHLQTESLLKNGKAGRGKAKTNERNAVGMATGNVSGPALASAQAALANLRQIRAMWESLLSASVQDLAQKGGGGGGGGGGGKKGNNAAWLADVERWYNWLQRIAQLEKDINYEETLRSKIQSDRNVNGKAYVDSLVRQLEATKEEEKYQASLADSQEAFFKKRRNEMNKSAFSKFYTFDEDGQLKYTEKSKLKNGDKGGFAALSDLMATNPDGSTKYTAEQQYNKIKAWGFGSTMLYDSSGKKITDENQKKGKHSDEFFTQSVQAFWDKIESDKEEMQKLRDSIDDANTKVLEMEQKRNELIKEMRDNQMDLEDKIMDALQNKLQSKIDEMQKKRDAYDKANQKFIKGLQDSLAREQDMYQRQEDKTELSKMRRQLAILQRSGGSASSIASLQNDIREREKDQYFDERQAQVDAIQTASDKQLEKMDSQISIAQETLDYQKRMGLLWSQVYDIMGGSGNSILNFLSKYSTDFTSLSTLGQTDLQGQWKAQIDEYKRWQEKQQDNEVGQKWNVAKDAIKQSKLYSKVYGTGYEYTNSKGEKVNVDKAAKDAFERVYKNTGDENKARQAATKIYSDAQKQYEKENPAKPEKPSKEPGKTDGKKEEEKHGYSIYDRKQGKYVHIASAKSKNAAKNAAIAWINKNKGNKKYGTLTYRYYKRGGQVDYTGIAQVDGTPSRPEAFFNAEQTKILKNGLLGNSSRILASTLEEFNSIVEGMANGATYNTIDRGSSLVIENASVNMNVQSIANDYDARRAGEQALEQMMKIARKSGTKGVSRR